MAYNQGCPLGTRRYTIQSDDTVYKLARQFNTTVSAIISANPQIDPNFLRIGQVICIPQQRQFPSCPEGNYYRIRRGDTFYSIARNFNVSVADLKEANPGVNPDQLRIGQIICIPLATPPVTCPSGTRSYKVQRGDTFYAIARKFNVTIDNLRETNPNINPNSLLVGQRICIPIT